MPTIPHKPAGCRIDPPVSVPIAAGDIPADTAAAEPPLDPPGDRVRSHGFPVFLNAEFSVEPPIANSSMLVRPTSTAPASRSFVITVASYGARKLSRIRDAHVVFCPRSQKMSFTATGNPASRPTGFFLAR